MTRSSRGESASPEERRRVNYGPYLTPNLNVTVDNHGTGMMTETDDFRASPAELASEPAAFSSTAVTGRVPKFGGREELTPARA